MKSDKIEKPFFLHGGDYNPEQWIKNKEIWDEDMRLMKKANCNTMTVGVFSWSFLEPSDGEYDFSFLDEIINKIYQNGGYVILGTPSGARPRWLAEKYPEVLRVNERGERMYYSERHNHCFSSFEYIRKVKEIDAKLAERYGSHPALLAWHISNEFGGECFCPLCVQAFRDFLRKKYHNDIEELNDAYWTGFWSHRYDSFEQVEPPMELGDKKIHGLNLDWRRFVTYKTREFFCEEKSAIRQYSDKPVTTNFMMIYEKLDYWEFGKDVDIISWDSYPDWHRNQLQTAYKTAFCHDLFRSIKGKPFLLMESAPGLTNWKEYNHLKRPGMNGLEAMQAVAHGSDSVMYFQWRKGRGGCEKLHGAVVDHSGNESTRIFNEVASTGELLKTIKEAVGSQTASQAAVYYDWENLWAAEDCEGYKNCGKNYTETCMEYYSVLWRRAISADIVCSKSEFSKYKFLILPMVYMVDKQTIDKISEFVYNGGTVFATYMLGIANETDLCYLNGFPADKLKDVFGIRNEETDTLYPEMQSEIKYNGKLYRGKDFAEIIHLRGAKTLACYNADFYKGQPAFTVNEYGKGKAYYQAFRDSGEFKFDAIRNILNELEIKGAIPCTNNELLTAHKRFNGKNEYLFVENYSNHNEKNIKLYGQYIDLQTNKKTKKIDLAPYGVKILKRENL